MALAGAAAAAVTLGLLLPGTASSTEATTSAEAKPAGATLEVVSTGLNNVRKVTWDPRVSAVYVAEAGQSSAPCIGDSTNGCFTTTGAIFGYSPGYQTGNRVVTGLPALRTSRGMAGLNEVNPYGSSEVRAAFGLGGLSALRDSYGAAAAPLGQVTRIQSNGEVSLVADLVTFEEQNNPDGRVPDSNPFGMATDASGSVVVDAAANAVLHVDNNGLTSVLAVPPGVPFADRQLEPVPAAVVKGPDGYFYFGELTGAPFPQGQSRVWKVKPGEPARLEANGSQTVLAREGLSHPGGLAISPNGDIYISNNMTGADGQGQLLRL